MCPTQYVHLTDDLTLILYVHSVFVRKYDSKINTDYTNVQYVNTIE
jgi:hypothetical protein